MICTQDALGGLAMNENVYPDKQMNRPTPREQLLSLPPTKRPSWLAEQLQHEIATILSVTPDDVSRL
jgi:hypothetical protein